MDIVWQILIIFLLTLLNGFFSGAEIALVSVRKTRIASLIKQGNSRAAVVLQLKEKPDKLFATIQIGISLLTIAASAFAGSKIAQQLGQYFAKQNLPVISEYAFPLSFVLIVVGITYVSLVLGELVPKSLGLRYAEKISLFAAYPIWWLSRITSWLVKILNASSNFILKPFKDSTNFTETRLSEEEIRMLLAEGRRQGSIEAHEHHIIENVFDFADLTVGKIMVPRTQIVAFNVNSPPGEVIRPAIDSGYSRIPIFQDTLNNIVGILYTKGLLKKLGEPLHDLDLRGFLVPPYFVPNSMKISEVLQRLQRKKLQMALVTDEHGEIEGLVTIEDILEEIVGDITDETDEGSGHIVKQGDGSYLVSGQLSILDFNKYFNSSLPEDEEYGTVSGFLLQKLGRFPDEGDKVSFEGFEFVVKEKTQRIVKTAIVKKQAQ